MDSRAALKASFPHISWTVLDGKFSSNLHRSRI